MRRVLRKMIVVAGIAGALALTLFLSSQSPAGTPYASALTGLVNPAMAASGCEDKTCFIAPDGNQSKCVANIGTTCTIQSVQGRGHGRICVTNTCF